MGTDTENKKHAHSIQAKNFNYKQKKPSSLSFGEGRSEAKNMEIIKSVTEFFNKHFGPQPSVSLDELDFLVRPHIIKRGKKFLLRYQMASTEPPLLIRPIQAKRLGNKAYYFFGLAVSRYDLGELVEHDIALDHFIDFVENDQIYWLNKDGTEVDLEVRII